MKNLHAIDESLNEYFKLDAKDETLLSKMTIKGDDERWVLNVVALNDSGNEYVIITGKYAKSTTDLDTIWIPKDQFEEFKKMINSI